MATPAGALIGSVQAGSQLLGIASQERQHQRQLDATVRENMLTRLDQDRDQIIESMMTTGKEMHAAGLSHLIEPYIAQFEPGFAQLAQNYERFGGNQQNAMRPFQMAASSLMSAPGAGQMATQEGVNLRTSTEAALGRGATDAEMQRKLGMAPPAPLVSVQNLPAEVEKTSEIERAKYEAKEMYENLPAQENALRESDRNLGVLQNLIERGTPTGKVPEALKSWVKDTYGVDLGLDPNYEQFAAVVAQENVARVRQLGTNPTDRDMRVIEQTNLSPGRGSEANEAILIQRKAINRRAVEENQEKRRYFQRNKTLAGYDEYLRQSYAGKDLFTPEETQRLDQLRAQQQQNARQMAEDAVQAVLELTKALAEGSASRVSDIVSGMSQEQIRGLPTETLEQLNRVLGN